MTQSFAGAFLKVLSIGKSGCLGLLCGGLQRLAQQAV